MSETTAHIWPELQAALPGTEAEFPLQFSEKVEPSVVSVLNLSRRQLYSGAEPSLLTQNAQVVLDFAWEKLNTGTWRDVDKEWRRVYSYGCLFRVASLCQGEASEATLREAIRSCDMGLLMGAAILDNVLQTVVGILQSRLRKRHSEEENSNEGPDMKRLRTVCASVSEVRVETAVPRMQCPSLEGFRSDYLTPHKPVILQGVIDHWPACKDRRWSIDYLRRAAGCRTVPVELGSRYTDEEWSQSLITVNEFIDRYITGTEGGPVGYLAQHQLFDQIPELKEDIRIPDYCCLGEGEEDDITINAWFGPAGTVSPLHQDPQHNFLAQVVGRKYIRLYSPEDSDKLYPHQSHLLHNTSQVHQALPVSDPIYWDYNTSQEYQALPVSDPIYWDYNTSQVDVECPDAARFPDFSKAPYQECVLQPGEVLFIPVQHWHYVRALDLSFSVSFWWS
ncbi:lysine-specific demethylase 8 isoform X2 [Conger conger]|uniref:lysine-specific demethylase 8 isoform X2 n=1 Tax=Conger conger TaxID=82655 RepID=UPI002A5A1462|nr:lysine-specific demethylase 8 isoform X2 [Conger conger]